MDWNVVDIKIIEHLKLEVKFEDGLVGTATFPQSHLRGVLLPLKDPNFFAKVEINHGCVSWPGELDIAPDAMHDDIEATGEWVLSSGKE